jgi:hypothetical protein
MIQSESAIRDLLLTAAVCFVARARACAGVTRIALIGSLTTLKRKPKDVDRLVTVDDAADLSSIATTGRRLVADSYNRGDVFLADPSPSTSAASATIGSVSRACGADGGGALSDVISVTITGSSSSRAT